MEGLFKRIDNSGIVLFRIVFGIIILIETTGAILTGWVDEIFIKPEYTFPYIGFEWLQPLPGYGMYFYYGLMAVLGLFIALGYCYRLSTILFAFLWWGTYLMQKAHYNNHYYLMVLLAFIMIIVPANKTFSIDVKRKSVKEENTCFAWCHYLLVFQISVVFLFAGIAKVNNDWLSMRPLAYKFIECGSWPVVGPLFLSPSIKVLVFYGGLLFDLSIVPLLLWPASRKYGAMAAIFFNLFNAVVFQVGTFPFLMIGALILYFPPEWVGSVFLKRRPSELIELATNRNNYVSVMLALYVIIQLYLPLRHLHYEGDVDWNEEGYSMAWRMMLNSKSGIIHFIIKDSKGNLITQDNPKEKLSYDQYHSMYSDPDMIWQYVQYLKQEMYEKGNDSVKIYATSLLGLNGREMQLFVDPAVDLTKVEWKHFSHSDWVLPLNE